MEDILVEETENPTTSVVKKRDITILICSVLLGVLFNILFYKKSLGISYPIFVITFYVVFLWNLRHKITFKFSFGWVLSIPIALSFTYFIFSNKILSVRFFSGSKTFFGPVKSNEWEVSDGNANHCWSNKRRYCGFFRAYESP